MPLVRFASAEGTKDPARNAWPALLRGTFVTHPEPQSGPSAEMIATRVAIAAQDLRDAEAVNVAFARPADLVALLSRVTAALSDMIKLHHERDAAP